MLHLCKLKQADSAKPKEPTAPSLINPEPEFPEPSAPPMSESDVEEIEINDYPAPPSYSNYIFKSSSV